MTTSVMSAILIALQAFAWPMAVDGSGNSRPPLRAPVVTHVQSSESSSTESDPSSELYESWSGDSVEGSRKTVKTRCDVMEDSFSSSESSASSSSSDASMGPASNSSEL